MPRSTPPPSKRGGKKTPSVPPPAPGSKAARDAKRLKTARRRAEILALRQRGLGLAQIAERLGISKQAVHKHLQVAIARVVDEPAQDAVKLELMRLDAMLDGIWDVATAGDTYAIDAVMKIAGRRAKLLGLDAPTKNVSEVTGKDGAPLLPSNVDVSKLSRDDLAELAAGRVPAAARAGAT
jgi:DNA-binding CsgD family transcriptional regulator